MGTKWTFRGLLLPLVYFYVAAAAADARVDSRVMFSVGRAARSLGLLGASVTLVLGIPLSVSGKSPFFDRKPKK